MTEDASRWVVGWVRADFGLDLATLDEVTHGADQHARLWLGQAADGSRYAVKLSGGGTPAGLVVMAYLAGQGCRASRRRCVPPMGGCAVSATAAASRWCRGCPTTGHWTVR
ncbi:hypothetical protein GCM10027614_17530 [Micromonospora vulcania]